MTERTLILIKPDGVAGNLIGEILHRFEAQGYRIEELRMLTASQETLANHYAEHRGKSFYRPLVDYMASGPLVVVILSGNNVVAGARAMLGSSNPAEAAPGTIRGDLGRVWAGPVQKNLVHASDSEAAAEREIALWLN